VFSSESSRREFLRRAAAAGISASAAVTLLGALAERTVAAAGTDILTAQTPTLIPGGWGAGYLSQYLVNLAQQIQLEAIGGIDIETDGPGHVLMIAVDEGSLGQERLVGVLKEAFVGHEVEVVRLTAG
jgi:hypothetical protein